MIRVLIPSQELLNQPQQTRGLSLKAVRDGHRPREEHLLCGLKEFLIFPFDLGFLFQFPYQIVLLFGVQDLAHLDDLWHQ